MSLRSINTGNNKFSRRDFLKIAGIGVATTAILTGCGPLLENVELDLQVSNELGIHMAKQFGIKSVYLPSGNTTFLKESSNVRYSSLTFGYGQVTSTMEMLYKEFCKYPPEFFEAVRDTNWGLTLCQNMEYQENEEWLGVGGMVISTPQGSDLLVNVSSIQSYTGETTHHELFHCVSDDTPKLDSPFIIDVDDKLTSVNSRFKLNGNKFRNYKEASSCSVIFPEIPIGFEECYGQRNANEDGATIADALMMGDKSLWERMVNDAALKEKTLAVIGTYKDLTNGVMDEQVFSRLKNGERDLWNWPEIPKEVYNP